MTNQMDRKRYGISPELTGKCRIDGVGTVLIMLTSKEIKHFNTLALLKRQIGICLPAKTKVPETVKNIFIGKKENEADERLHYAKLDYYRKTVNFEVVSRLFYQRKAADAEHEDERQLFLSLAGEVEKHLRILEIFLNFTVRPGTEPENAGRQQLEGY